MTLLLAALLAAPAAAHFRFACPTPRTSSANIKNGPCGEGDFSAPTEIAPGPLTLVWEETIIHTGAPWRISLSQDGVEDGFCTLLDHIPHNDNAQRVDGKNPIYKLTVNIPDVACESCALQFFNPMTDKITAVGLTDCVYDNPAPEGAPNYCFSTYHSCANVKITGTTPRADYVCPPQPADWPFRGLQEGLYTPTEAGTWTGSLLTDAPPAYQQEAGVCANFVVGDPPSNGEGPQDGTGPGNGGGGDGGSGGSDNTAVVAGAAAVVAATAIGAFMVYRKKSAPSAGNNEGYREAPLASRA